MFIAALICSVLAAPQQETAKELLAKIDAAGAKAPIELFDQLAKLQSKEALRGLLEAAGDQKQDKANKALLSLKHFSGVEGLEDDAVEFLMDRASGSNAKNAFHAVLAMGGLWPAAAEEWVEIALGHDSMDCRTLALMHLLDRNMDVDDKVLKKLAASKDEMVRYEGVLAQLQRADDPQKRVLKLVRSKHVAERLAVVEYLCTGDVAQKIALLETKLSDKDRRVNRKCLSALERIGSADAVGVLIRRLEVAEAGERWRTTDALRGLTGMSFRAEVGPWKRWWAKEKNNFKPRNGGDTKKAAVNEDDETAASFYGLAIRAQHLVFTVDSSDSMKGKAKDGRSRIEIAKEQLRSAIAELPDGSTFDIVNFGKNAKSWNGELIEAKSKQRQRALEHVDRMGLSWGTQVYEALRTAYQDPSADAIVLLTDGDPQLTMIMDRNLIRRMVVQWNRTRHVQIDCITIGTDRGWLRKIAEATGGRYLKVE